VVTLIGIEFAFLIGGWSSPSRLQPERIGRLLVQAVAETRQRARQALVMLVVACCSLTNLVVDVLYAWLDPRIRIVILHDHHPPTPSADIAASADPPCVR